MWLAATPKERIALEPRIRLALRAHGGDGAAGVLRHYLAWILLEKGALAESEKVLRNAATEPGTTADFSRVLRAGILLRKGKSAQALAELRQIHGSLIAPDHRSACDELLIEAALAQKQIALATHYMLDLLLNTPVLRQESMQQKLAAWFDTASSSDIEDAYTNLVREQPSDAVDRRKHAQALNLLLGFARRRLLAAALKDQDAELAQRIIDHYVPGADTEELARLAATGNLPPRVVGRSLGLLLEVGSSLSSQRSAQVALGISTTLELFAPQPGTEVLLRTRTATADSASIPLAYHHLISDGAALVIGGMTEQSALTLFGLAEQDRMPTLILTQPPNLPSTRHSAFMLGELTQQIVTVLRQWAAARKLEPQVIASDDPRCSFEGTRVGEFSFPVTDWKQHRVSSLLMLGSENCAMTLLGELDRAQFAPILILGIDVAHLFRSARHATTFSAGTFPAQSDVSGTDNRPPSWYYSLGHDAALFGAFATRDFDSVMTNQPDEIELLHSKVAATLREAQVDGLWTTGKRGFNSELVLERELKTATHGAR